MLKRSSSSARASSADGASAACQRRFSAGGQPADRMCGRPAATVPLTRASSDTTSTGERRFGMATQTADKSQQLINRAIKERESRRSGKSRVRAIISVATLAALSVISIVFLYPGNHSLAAPVCDGKTMSPGDICDRYVNGVLDHSYNFQQMLAQQRADNPTWLVLGIIGIAAAVFALVMAFTRLSPGRPWGTAQVAACPQCGQPSLSEKKMAYS